MTMARRSAVTLVKAGQVGTSELSIKWIVKIIFYFLLIKVCNKYVVTALKSSEIMM